MSSFTLQGRQIDEAALSDIRTLLGRQPPLSRRQLSIQLCGLWNWRTDAGRVKDIAARSLLRKLEQRGLIQLPPIVHLPPRARAGPPLLSAHTLPLEFASPAPIEAPLAELAPVKLSRVESKCERRLFGQLLQEHHYLGWNRPVGESIAYWAHDRSGRLLALCLWGAAAWKVALRDRWIGWSPAQRVGKLKFLANNQRFLILPWARVPHLGSHLLGQMQRRLRWDWQRKYQHDLYLLESFVQMDRFQATIYRAANWTQVGQTQGRSRQDRFHRLDLPRKSIWMFALETQFRQRLYEPDPISIAEDSPLGLRLFTNSHP